MNDPASALALALTTPTKLERMQTMLVACGTLLDNWEIARSLKSCRFDEISGAAAAGPSPLHGRGLIAARDAPRLPFSAVDCAAAREEILDEINAQLAVMTHARAVAFADPTSLLLVETARIGYALAIAIERVEASQERVGAPNLRTPRILVLS